MRFCHPNLRSERKGSSAGQPQRPPASGGREEGATIPPESLYFQPVCHQFQSVSPLIAQ